MMLTEHDEPMPHLADKFDIEAMRANRDAGTPGPWGLDYTGGDTKLLAGRETLMCDMTYYPWCPENQSDWLRIALVPSMEAQIERLTADLARAVEALEAVFSDHGKVNSLAWTDRTAAALASIKDKANE